MYGTTEKKITHIIDESRGRGWGGFVSTACGQWIRPDRLTQDRPDGARMCKKCDRKKPDLYRDHPLWISVKERFPEPGVPVLVSNGKRSMEAYRTIYHTWERNGAPLICMVPIEWMPMPKGSDDVG